MRKRTESALFRFPRAAAAETATAPRIQAAPSPSRARATAAAPASRSRPPPPTSAAEGTFSCPPFRPRPRAGRWAPWGGPWRLGPTSPPGRPRGLASSTWATGRARRTSSSPSRARTPSRRRSTARPAPPPARTRHRRPCRGIGSTWPSRLPTPAAAFFIQFTWTDRWGLLARVAWPRRTWRAPSATLARATGETTRRSPAPWPTR